MDDNKKIEEQSSDNPFALSTGDLMAALLFIFILLLSATMLKITEQQDDINNLANEYYQKKQDLYHDLDSIFPDSILKSWGAEIDSTELIVRFKEPKTLFDYNKAELKPRFTEILSYFFPRYIQLLYSPKYNESIEEIRIEGHTDMDGSYYYNMELSQNRTRAVLEFCLDSLKDHDSIREWSKKRITANGLSYSHPVLTNDSTVDADQSRRVEFRIKTNAEKKLTEIMDTIFAKSLSTKNTKE